jgi:Icc protein
MIIVQITDLHLRGDGVVLRHDPLEALACAIGVINHMRPQPDAVLFTGDILDRSTSDYSLVLPLLHSLLVPLLPLPGNHDDKFAFRAAFSGMVDFTENALDFARHLGDGMVVGLDSNGEKGTAAIDPAQLNWLGDILKNADCPVMIALHHPPFATGMPRYDDVPFCGADALMRMIGASPRVTRLVSGHTHRSVSSVAAGIQVSTSPPLGYALALALVPDAAHAHISEAPALQIHIVNGGNSVTHTVSLLTQAPAEGMTTALDENARATLITP